MAVEWKTRLKKERVLAEDHHMNDMIDRDWRTNHLGITAAVVGVPRSLGRS